MTISGEEYPVGEEIKWYIDETLVAASNDVSIDLTWRKYEKEIHGQAEPLAKGGGGKIKATLKKVFLDGSAMANLFGTVGTVTPFTLDFGAAKKIATLRGEVIQGGSTVLTHILLNVWSESIRISHPATDFAMEEWSLYAEDYKMTYD